MKEYTYIIIGGGAAAYAAAQGIREKDPAGSIGIFTREEYKPYKRPPLSKGLWKELAQEKIWFDIKDDHLDILTNQDVIALQADKKTISTDHGEEYKYKALLIATGAEPQHLPFSDDDIIYYRRFADYMKLKELVEKHASFAVVGAGFIGSEIAAALALNKKKVTLLEAGSGIGWKVFPEEIVQYLNDYYTSKGIQVLAKHRIQDIVKQGNQHQIILDDQNSLTVDGVVAGVGVKASTELADKAGLAVMDGIKVNSYLETSKPSIFAAGDVAVFHSTALDKVIRFEHQDNAMQMGKIAGMNMAGANLEYDYLPMFYSDLFDIGYEAVGIIDARLDVNVVWKEKFKKGILYYLQDNLIKGILLWNEWDKVDQAREIIREQRWVDPRQLVNLL